MFMERDEVIRKDEIEASIEMANKIPGILDKTGLRKINNQSNATEELLNSTETWPENFSLSNYDDDDSGFCCPCCLPR